MSSCQGTVTITATDSCENEATKEMNMPEPEQGLAINGTEMPTCGDMYAVDGGTSPYTWSMSCGYFAAGGNGIRTCFSNYNCCGTGTINVTDANGKTGTKTVRMPRGVRVEVATRQGAGSIHPTCGG